MSFKKLLCLTLAIAIALSLVACGGSASSAAPVSSAVTSNGASSEAAVEEVKWPTGTINCIITASAGGDTDFNARTFATFFEKYTGKSMIVTNMAGSNGAIAMEEVKNAKNDGATILMCHTGQMIINEVTGALDYGMDSFEVACIPAINGSYVLAASAKSGFASFADFTAAAKASPKTVIYGTEMGGYTHLQSLQLQKLADIELKLVDMGSASDKVTALLNGSVDVAAVPYARIADYIQTGEIVALAQYGVKRNQYMSDIPTMTECNVDMVDVIPYIISFPEGTDPAIVAKMSDVALQIVEDPDYQKQIADSYQQEPTAFNTADTLDYLNETRDRYMGYKDLLVG